MEWLENYLRPLNKYLEYYSYPHFERLFECDFSRQPFSVHYKTDVGNIWCCNENPYKDFQQWYSKVISPQLDYFGKIFKIFV